MITAEDIKALRDVSGAGIMDCKRALVACRGHADLAKEWLRVMGFAIACKPGCHPREKVEAQAVARGACK